MTGRSCYCWSSHTELDLLVLQSPARLQSKAQQTDTGTDLTFQGSGLSGEIAGSSPPQAGEGGLPNLAKLAKGPQDFKSMLEAALRDSMGGNLPDIYAVE